MTRRFVLCGIVTFAITVLSGCGRTPTSPTVADISGTWVRESAQCTNSGGIHIEGCPITMRIMQTGTTLSGTFTREGTSGGSISGRLDKTTVSASLMLTATPGCAYELSGTINGDIWSGTGGFRCTGAVDTGNPGSSPYSFMRVR
jgi:hypothetical protein